MMGEMMLNIMKLLQIYFPDSILGITISTKAANLNESKLRALAAQYKIKSEYGIELPMFLYDKGKMVEFKPTKSETLEILNFIFQNKKTRLTVNETELKAQYLKLLSLLGFEPSNPGLVNPLDSSSLSKLTLWKKDIDLEEIDFFKKTCGEFVTALKEEEKRFLELKDDKSVKKIKEIVNEVTYLSNSDIKSNNDLRKNYKLFSQKIINLANEKIFKPSKFTQLINSIYKTIMQKLGYPTPQPLFSTKVESISYSYLNSVKRIYKKKETPTTDVKKPKRK